MGKPQTAKASACNEGDLGLIPESGTVPGEGKGTPLLYSSLENPMDGGAWWATVHGIAETQARLSDCAFFSFSLWSSLSWFSCQFTHCVFCCYRSYGMSRLSVDALPYFFFFFVFYHLRKEERTHQDILNKSIYQSGFRQEREGTINRLVKEGYWQRWTMRYDETSQG